MHNRTGAKILTVKDIEKLHYPLPASWAKAAGLLKHHRKDLERHLKKIRSEWDRPRKK